MRGAVTVPFTKSPAEEQETLISLKVPVSLHNYLKTHGLKTTVIRAVTFDKELGDLLADIEARVDAFANSQGLDRERSPAKIVAALMKRGLEAWEAEQKAPRKK